MSLAAQGLTLAMGPRAVVQGVDLELVPGEVTAVLGPNGAGKSTLLRGLAGLHRAQSGAVMLDGTSLQQLPANSSRVRLHNRCQLTGRPHAYYRKLKVSRIALRELASNGKAPGMVKSSW